MRKIIAPMEAFPNFFYKSCFFHSLFPIIRAFERETLPIFLNDVAVYARQGERLTVEYVEAQSLSEMLAGIGIVQHERMAVENVLEQVSYAIDQGHPVILWVDCFYLSGRPDTWQREHWPHTLLVFGSDSERNQFDVLEHLHRDSLAYEPRSISGSDLLQAYQGYVTHFADRSFPTFLEYEAQAGTASANHRFEQVLLANRERLLSGVDCLAAYVEQMIAIMLSEQQLSARVADLLADLNQIINLKLVERYKQQQLQADDQTLQLAEKLLEGWVQVRAAFAKFSFSGLYRQEAMRRLQPVLRELCARERNYAECVIGGVRHGGANGSEG